MELGSFISARRFIAKYKALWMTHCHIYFFKISVQNLFYINKIKVNDRGNCWLVI